MHGDSSPSPPLDPRLIQWLAASLLADEHARLIESGADSDARVPLAAVFVDLKATGCIGRRAVDVSVVREMVRGPAPETDEDSSPALCLLLGGPGAGKSTVTAMAAQLLRAPWMADLPAAWPEPFRARIDAVLVGLATVEARSHVSTDDRALPIRVNLPAFARWQSASQHGEMPDALFEHLAATMSTALRTVGLDAECSATEMRTLLGAAGRVVWLFDGLDEVPAGELRAAVSRAVHAVIAARRAGDRVVVTTRPQGYGGEFDDLAPLELRPLDWPSAQSFCERLVQAWSGASDLAALRQRLREEFARPEVQALARSPLHAAIVALFVARQDELPEARWVLFERYFNLLFDRELRKLSAVGIKSSHRDQLLEVHARAGLALHVRAQSQGVATLTVREFRGLLAAFYREDGLDEERVDEETSKMLRFASERLVLLLRVAEGGYTFGIRPLQEYFAARALWSSDAAALRTRLEAVALSPHWAEVVAMVGSGAASSGVDRTTRRPGEVLVGLCEALNAGTVGGQDAARCLLGSRLAIALLRETEGYGRPWFHDPLWQIALRIADTPVQRWALEWARGGDPSKRGPGKSSAWDEDEEIHTRLGLLATYWRGEGGERRNRDLLVIASRLMAGHEGLRWAGWHLLIGALRKDDEEARRIVLTHPPINQEEGQSFLEALLASPYTRRIPAVAIDLIRAQPGWYSPGWLCTVRLPNGGVDDAWPAVMKIAVALQDVRPKSLLVPVLPTRTWTGALDVALLAGRHVRRWAEIEAWAAEAGVHGPPWQKIAAFHQHPGPETLADALDALRGESFEDTRRVRRRFAWPLAACLSHVDTAEQLGALATSLRAGRLGTTETWFADEARWAANPVIDGEGWAQWVKVTEPWQPGEIGPPVTGISNTFRYYTTQPQPRHYRTTILEAIEAYGQAARRAVWAAAVTLSGQLDMGLWVEGVPFQTAERFRDVVVADLGGSLLAVEHVLPGLEGAEAPQWFELLDHRGRLGQTVMHRAVRGTNLPRVTQTVQHVARHLSQHPERGGLAETLVVLLQCAPDAPLDALRLGPPPADIPTGNIAQWRLLALLSDASLPNDLPTALASLRGSFEGEDFDFRHTLASILAHRVTEPTRTTALLRAALDSTTDADFLTREALLGALLAHLRRTAPRAFDSEAAWYAAHLPPPPVVMHPPPPGVHALVRIDDLTNLRLFRETPTVDAPFPTPNPDRGQWIVLLGENGVGKTTLLRALALALVAPEVAAKQLHSRLPLVRNGGPARLSFTLNTGTYRAEVSRVDGGATETVTTPGEAPTERPWVVGYGVRRGSALGEEGRIVDWAPEGNLHTLFDRQPALVVAQDWLLKLDRRVAREKVPREGVVASGSTPAADLWKAVAGALTRALELKDLVAADDDKVYVEHAEFGRVALESLSDGYLSTAGWIVDLVARWVRQREADGDVLVGDILGQMTGVVLLDEIDLHLHPRWQLRVIDDVRRIFPRLTFLVTTHNPLTLQGARPGEVFVVRRGDGGSIELSQRDIQPGHDMDRVLLEQFGVVHTFDHETRAWLREHRRLMTDGAGPEDPRRRALEQQLAERLGAFGDTVIAQRKSPPLSEVQRANLARFKQQRGTS